MNILIVEDEEKIASFIRQGLEELGNEVEIAKDGKVGKAMILAKNYDIVLLDLLLPYIGGLQLCEIIKKHHPATPVLMLTAMDTTEDKIVGFDKGADDYLVKPFEFGELVARIKAVTKRFTTEESFQNILKIKDLVLDLNRREARRGNQTINLTAKEFGLLEYLMRNKGKLVSRADISEKVWDIHFDTGTNVVDVYINILRKKIDKDFSEKLIHTRIGMGYIFQA